MKKFSKLDKYKKDQNIINNNDNIKIINYKNENIISSKDKIVILPYLKDEGYILLSYNNVAVFNMDNNNNNTNFIKVITDDKNDMDILEESIKKILLKTCGIVLRQNYPINIDNILFKNEQDNGQYYISLLELNYNDFKQIPPSDSKYQLIKINLGDIDTIKKYDLITEYMLLKLKYEYKI
jgi:hypothetical protein